MENRRAAIDISTGHAFDSYFRQDLRDPWAKDALRLFVDLAVNHDQLGFPYPSATALASDADEHLPQVFAVARGKTWGLVGGIRSAAADAIELPAQLVQPQFKHFARWLQEKPEDVGRLRTWLAMHFDDKRISGAHSLTVPRHFAAEFVGQKLFVELANSLKGIDPEGVEYAFDVFVRGIQYNIACGDDTTYFPHPIRARLSLPDSTDEFKSQCAWSWGSYVTTLIEKDARYRSMNAVLELVQAIKQRTRKGATWYDLAYMDFGRQLAAIEAVASEAGLPAHLRADWQLQIDRVSKAVAAMSSTAAALSGGNVTLLGASVGLLVTSSAAVISDLPKKALPPLLSRSKILRSGRVIEWQGLAKQ